MVDRALIVINTAAARKHAVDKVLRAPADTRVEFRGPKRSKEQSDRMWAMLTEISRQKKHRGQYYIPDKWKVLFLHALGQEVEFLPALDNESWIPYGQQSSRLSVKEMTELIDYIAAWGAQNGVTFNDPRTPPEEAA